MTMGKRQILIIDDSLDDLEFYARLLTKSSSHYEYKVWTAEGPSRGLEIFKSQKIDCTFIDFHMPEMDGLAVVDLLQKEKSEKHLPMVLLTGEHHQGIQAKAARQGALDYVIKDSISCSQSFEKIINKVISWANVLNTEKPLVQ